MIECDYWHFPPCSHLEQERSGGHRVGSVKKDLKCQLHLLPLRKLGVTPSIKVVEEQHIAEKLPSVVTDVEGDTLAKDTKSKKSILHSQPRTNHFFIRRPKDPKCGICEKQNNACKVSNKSLRSAWMGLTFPQKSESWLQQIWTWRMSRELDTRTLESCEMISRIGSRTVIHRHGWHGDVLCVLHRTFISHSSNKKYLAKSVRLSWTRSRWSDA